MKPQIYNLDTKFDFGKHKGRTLREVIYGYESRYIGWLIANDALWFILDLETIAFLDEKGLFNNLEMSLYTNGGSCPLSGLGYTKEDILALLKKRYEDFIKDPVAYEKLAKESLKEYGDRNRVDLRKP